MRFFLNSRSSTYLRNLSTEFNESTNSIRVELNRFENAGLLRTFQDGNKKMFRANTKHPLFPDIKNLLMKHTGLDQIILNVAEKLGEVKKVFIAGDFAKGLDNRIIDLLFIGKDINTSYLIRLIEKAEKMVNRKIRYLILTEEEFKNFKDKNKEDETLLIWGYKD